MSAARYVPPIAFLVTLATLAGGIRLYVQTGSALPVWKPDPRVYEQDQKVLNSELGRAPLIWEPARTPDIVVIVMDTTRLDRLGMYGYDKDTSPRLDAWAEKARVYDQFRADGPWTLPSHASLFTGRWPIAHGARGVPLQVPQQAGPLAKGSATVARSLRQAGYRTVGIAANKAFLDPSWGLSQGFDVWLCSEIQPAGEGMYDATADRVQRLAQAALARQREGSLFLFLNFIDPHTPWHLRDGYVREPDKIRRKSLPGGSAWQRATERIMADHEQTPENAASWSEAYDSEIRFMDEQLGELLEALPALGIGDEDYVFVLADHGEYLGEHDLVEHSKDVYEQVIHVPLLIRGPGYAPGRDATALQHHDLAGMILAAAGLPPLPDSASTSEAGVQVTESYFARKRDLANPALANRFDRIRRGFVQFPHKLILGDDGSTEAFDLLADGAELRSVPDAPWVAGMRAAATAWRGGQREAATVANDEPVNIEALRALGYVQ